MEQNIIIIKYNSIFKIFRKVRSVQIVCLLKLERKQATLANLATSVGNIQEHLTMSIIRTEIWQSVFDDWLRSGNLLHTSILNSINLIKLGYSKYLLFDIYYLYVIYILISKEYCNIVSLSKKIGGERKFFFIHFPLFFYSKTYYENEKYQIKYSYIIHNWICQYFHFKSWD